MPVQNGGRTQRTAETLWQAVHTKGRASSPSLIVWFPSAGGAVIAGIYSRTHSPPYLFLAGFFCCSLVWAVFMALLAGKGRNKLGSGALRIFSGASAAIFVALAVKVFLDGLAVT